jgi:hypothetical protein
MPQAQPALDPSRADRFTASMAPRLMAGDHAYIQRFFLRATGDPRYTPGDFEDSWLSAYGMAIEPVALEYYATKHGVEFTGRGEQVFHPTREFVSATLDARLKGRVVDVKATVDPTKSVDETVAFYTPQIIVQEECAGADGGDILIVRCGAEPMLCPVYIDPLYRDEVWAAIDRFWHCVETLTPPFPLQFPKLVPPEKWRKIDLDSDTDLPNWAEDMRTLLGVWSATESDFKAHEEIKVAIKKILPDDCGKLNYSGLVISRARNNAVSIKRAKERT